ncbi:MAG: maleylpyruvate isomerase family mycothiol-dependent enzyme [Ilumatobacteraceae bacterium]
MRAAFSEASATFLRALRKVGEEYWDRPGALGEWTTRELVAHALRAYITIDGYLAAEPTTDRVIADAGEYYAIVLADAGVHQGVATRARQAGRQLIDPIGQSEVTAANTLALVASTPDDEPVNNFAGQIPFIEYLATRTVELGVHTLDLQRATGQEPELHRDTSAVIVSILASLAKPEQLILALTGRGSLADGFNVLG